MASNEELQPLADQTEATPVVSNPQSASPPQDGNAEIHAKPASRPGSRSGVPKSNLTTFKLATKVNGVGSAPSVELPTESSAVVDSSAKGHQDAAALNVRWKHPLTVSYNEGGQAQPGVLQQLPTNQEGSPPEPTPTSAQPPQQTQQPQAVLPAAPQPPQQQQQPLEPQPQPPRPQSAQPAPSVPPQQLPHLHTAPQPPAYPLPPPRHIQQHAAPQTRPGTQISPTPPSLPSQQPPHNFHPHQPPASQYHFKQYQPRPAPLPKGTIIMDPPAVRRANQQPQSQSSQGFPSPNQEYARINPKFIDDCTRMTYAIQQSLPEAVRRVVRDNWDKCLLGSEFHQAFILNASIHHALPSITQRAVTDFGAKLVSECLPEIIGHISTARLDEVADSIIAKASNAFLDKCLEKRLPTIEVEPLTQALARAERLGFRHDDEIQREGQHERVIPHEAYPGASVPWAASHHHAPPPAPEYYSVQPLQCSRCFRTFKLAPPYDYHMRYGVCSLPPPTANGFLTSCPHCGQGFERQEDLNGHLHAQACDYLGTTPPASQQPPPVKLSRGPGRPRRSSPPSQAPVSILPSQGTPAPPNGHLPSQHSTPLPSRVAAVAATPTTASPSGVDPYAHLTQEQRDRMNAELLEAEQRYGPRFLEAEMIADENEKRAKIDGLRNSFGTKQSMIRKKYGVRLRERRTKAEIAAERERLGLKKAEKENALAAAKEALASAPQTGRGWVAANTNTPQDEGHDAKRRRLADGGSGNVTPFRRLPEEEEDTPTRKISGSGGGGDQQQQDQPGMIPERPSPRIPPSATPTLSGALKPEQPSQPSEQISLEDDDDESSSSDDEDIPPTLPAHIRQSLANSSPLGKAGGGGGGGLVRGMLPGERTSSSTTP